MLADALPTTGGSGREQHGKHGKPPRAVCSISSELPCRSQGACGARLTDALLATGCCGREQLGGRGCADAAR